MFFFFRKLEKEVEGVKQSSQKEINRLNTQLEETQQELEKKIVELQKIQHEYAASMGLDEVKKINTINKT